MAGQILVAPVCFLLRTDRVAGVIQGAVLTNLRAVWKLRRSSGRQ